MTVTCPKKRKARAGAEPRAERERDAPGLDELRHRIDEVDRRLVLLIARRCRLARETGARKRLAGRGLCDPDQENVVLARAAARARAAGLREDRVRRLFAGLIGLSLEVQAEAPAAPEGPPTSPTTEARSR